MTNNEMNTISNGTQQAEDTQYRSIRPYSVFTDPDIPYEKRMLYLIKDYQRMKNDYERLQKENADIKEKYSNLKKKFNNSFANELHAAKRIIATSVSRKLLSMQQEIIKWRKEETEANNILLSLKEKLNKGEV